MCKVLGHIDQISGLTFSVRGMSSCPFSVLGLCLQTNLVRKYTLTY